MVAAEEEQQSPVKNPSPRYCEITFPKELSFEVAKMPHIDVLEADDYIKNINANQPLSVSISGDTSFTGELNKALQFLNTGYHAMNFEYCGYSVPCEQTDTFDTICQRFIRAVGAFDGKGVFELNAPSDEMLDNAVFTARAVSQLLNIEMPEIQSEPIAVRYTHKRYDSVEVEPNDSIQQIFEKFREAKRG